MGPVWSVYGLYVFLLVSCDFCVVSDGFRLVSGGFCLVLVGFLCGF